MIFISIYLYIYIFQYILMIWNSYDIMISCSNNMLWGIPFLAARIERTAGPARTVRPVAPRATMGKVNISLEFWLFPNCIFANSLSWNALHLKQNDCNMLHVLICLRKYLPEVLERLWRVWWSRAVYTTQFAKCILCKFPPQLDVNSTRKKGAFLRLQKRFGSQTCGQLPTPPPSPFIEDSPTVMGIFNCKAWLP